MLTGYEGSSSLSLQQSAVTEMAVYTLVATVGNIIKRVMFESLTFEEKSSFPGVPTAREAGFPELSWGMSLERLVGGPPGVPVDRIKILETAMLKAMADPEFKAKNQKTPFSARRVRRNCETC